MREHLYYVYILASGRNGTLYTGVTNDIARRVWEHKNDLADGFTKNTASTSSFGTKCTKISKPLLHAKSRSKAGTALGKFV